MLSVKKLNAWAPPRSAMLIENVDWVSPRAPL